MTPKRFSLTALAAVYAVIYAVPAGKTALLKNLTLTNTTGADAVVSLHIVPAGQSPALGNALLYNLTVPALGMFDWQGLHVLEAGDELYAVGDGVTAIFSGTEL